MLRAALALHGFVTDNFGDVPFPCVIRLLFVLEEEIVVRIAEGSFDIYAEDFLILNKIGAATSHDIPLLLSTTVRCDVFAGKIRCNSVLDIGEKYEQFRYTIGHF